MKKNKAIFLDRDGVINQSVVRDGVARAPYILDELVILPGVVEAVANLKAAGFMIVVVTNQPDAVRGWVSFENIHAVNARIMEMIKADALKVCLHDNGDNCPCRKPKPGMLLEAAAEKNIDFDASFMVGDRYSDIAAGVAAGCRTILIGPGDAQRSHPAPNYQAPSLLAAGAWIIAQPIPVD
jgi:D-glycero-D-manno-heptose 1,7-bisphosphate phosphatase